jgi:CRP/FNR family cyclic AMP-dependent transcriptional regulator
VALGRLGRARVIRSVPLFARCSRRELNNIAGIAVEKHFPKGEDMVREGDTGSSFYVVLDGEAEIRRGGQGIDMRGGGEFFGEIALVAHSPRTATVRARTPVHALVIDGREFRALLGRQPDLQLKVLEALAERV